MSFPIGKSFKHGLLGLVQIVVEDNNRLVLANGEAHVAYAILFGITLRQSFLVLAAFLAHLHSTSVAVVWLRLEGAQLSLAVGAGIRLLLVDLVMVKNLW